MKNVFKNIVLLVTTLMAAYLLSPSSGLLYEKIFKNYGGWVNLSPIIGFPLAYIFFLTLFFVAFGDEKKKSWIGVLLIPAGMAEVYLDITHIYFPVALAILGWIIGFGIAKLTTKLSSPT